jgi:hypothetical protein
VKNKQKTWIGFVHHQSVHKSDDIDIGDVDAASRDFVVVEGGFDKSSAIAIAFQSKTYKTA